MSEYLFESNANKQDLNLYLTHRLISEAAMRSEINSNLLTIYSQPLHLDKLRIEVAFIRNPKSMEESEFCNPLRRIKQWLSLNSIPLDEVRIETPKGICRIYNLNYTY
jgi:hypothetical protein